MLHEKPGQIARASSFAALHASETSESYYAAILLWMSDHATAAPDAIQMAEEVRENALLVMDIRVRHLLLSVIAQESN